MKYVKLFKLLLLSRYFYTELPTWIHDGSTLRSAYNEFDNNEHTTTKNLFFLARKFLSLMSMVKRLSKNELISVNIIVR